MSRSKVLCSKCNDQHFSDEVKFLNVEEDVLGRDVFYYECPVTLEETSSLVYNTPGENNSFWD